MIEILPPATPKPDAEQARRRASKRRSMLLGAVALAALATAGVMEGVILPPHSPAVAQQKEPAPAVAVPGQASFADLVDRVKPAVVSVRVKVAVDNVSNDGPSLEDFGFPPGSPFEQFFKRFGQQQDRRGNRPRQFGEAQGSGFFISQDGYIVTNNHVVDHGADVEVKTDDGRTLSAKVIGTDSKTDIALLKVNGSGPFPYVSLANNMPRVGDWVIAVGNPFGLGGTVTAGIVSARGRDIGAGPYDDFLQIDAPVNKGNSGGPTFNLEGQVVGMNTAIASPSGGSVGIAFAIPSETVQKVVAQLKEHGSVSRGYIGVQIQPVTKEIAASLGLEKPEGAIVARVEGDGPAGGAGIKTGDAIVAVNGKAIKDARELSREIADHPPGANVTLKVWRDGKAQDYTVKLAKMPGEKTAAADDTSPEEGSAKLGLRLAPASSVDGAARRDGVVVVSVEPGSPADDHGLKTGDVIVEVGGRKVDTPSDVREAVAQVRKEGRKAVLFRVETGDGARFVALPLA